MLVQNNYSPFVVMIIILMIFAIAFGLLLGDLEKLNPERTTQRAYAEGTRMAIESQQFMAEWALTATPRALVMQATDIPIRHTMETDAILHSQELEQATATAIAFNFKKTNTQLAAEATRQHVANEMNNAQVAAQATRSYLVNQETYHQFEAIQNFIVPVVLAILLILVVSLVRSVVIVRAQSELERSQAQAYIEQRRTLIVQESLARRGEAHTVRVDTPFEQSPRLNVDKLGGEQSRQTLVQ